MNTRLPATSYYSCFWYTSAHIMWAGVPEGFIA